MLREFITHDFYTIIFIICIILVTATKQLFFNRFNDLITAIWSHRYLNIHDKERKGKDLFNLILILNFIISICVYALITYRFFNNTINNSPYILLSFLGVVVALFLIKYILERLIAYFFGFSAFGKKYLFQKTTFKIISGIVFLLFNVLLIFSNINTLFLIYCSAFIVLLLNVIGFVKFLRANQKIIISNFFYFLLYLCALEIGPYVILIKVLKDNFD